MIPRRLRRLRPARARAPGDLRCRDCRLRPAQWDYFMVQHALWAQHGAGRYLLCTACFEARLGRPLVPADLLLAPVNVDYVRARLARDMV